MGAAVAIPLVIAAVGMAAKQVSSIEAGKAQEEAIKQREQQEKTAAEQKSLQRTSALKKIISTQEAQAGVRGIDISSPSFQAIEEDSFNQWAQDERSGDLSQRMSRDAYEDQINAVRQQKFWNVFLPAVQMGASAYDIAHKDMGSTDASATGTSSTGAKVGELNTYDPQKNTDARYKAGL